MCPFCQDKPCNKEWCPHTKPKDKEMKTEKQTSGVGTWDKTVWFDPKDPADEKRAWMEAFNMTSERYDEIKASTKKWMDDFDEKYPLLKNLVWITTDKGQEMYYTDDEGNRIDTEIHLEKVGKVLEDTLRDNLKDRIPQAEIETRIEVFKEVLDGKDIICDDTSLKYVNLDDFKDYDD